MPSFDVKIAVTPCHMFVDFGGHNMVPSHTLVPLVYDPQGIEGSRAKWHCFPSFEIRERTIGRRQGE
jgi:hypothetical protein